MATFEKRGSKTRVTVRMQGIYESGTFSTKREAENWATQVEADILSGKRGQIPNKTFGQLLQRYSLEVSPTKRSKAWEQQKILTFLEDPIAEVKLADFNNTHVAAWRGRRLKTVSAGTVRREWNILSNACTTAKTEWKWLNLNPFREVKRPPPPQPRSFTYTDQQIAAIIQATGYFPDSPPTTLTARVGAIFLYAIETGMRLKEMTRLTRTRVHFKEKYVSVNDDSKTLRRDVPQSQEALRLLKQLMALPESEDGTVFQINEGQVDSLFRKCKSRALVKDLTFHDTKHTACTRLAKKITVFDLARMLGTRDLKTLMIYYNESASNISKLLN